MSDQRKAVIKNADMEDKMQQDAVDIASKALSEYNIEKVSVLGTRRMVLVVIAVLTRVLLLCCRMLLHTLRRSSTEDTILHGE